MRIAIIDDEALARQRLHDLLRARSGVEVVGEAGDGRTGVELCARSNPDVVLLDIAMPGMDGIQTARELARLEPAPLVVFCTAHDAHALSAFEAQAIDYLVKPVRAERLGTALDRVAAMLAGKLAASAQSGQRSHLCARMRGNMRLIPIDEVLYLQADEKYVMVHHLNGEDLIEESLKSLEDEFGERFVRIHRNCLVARNQLAALQRGSNGHMVARLRDSTQLLDVSRRSVGQLRDLLKHL